MKNVLVKISLFILLVGDVYGQSSELLTLSNENPKINIQRIERLGEVYKITNKVSGSIYYKNLNKYKARTPKGITRVDTTIIYPDLVDTTQFSNMYEFWTTVPIGTFAPEIIVIGDVNENGRTELYGIRGNSNLNVNQRSMYEYNPVDDAFDLITDMPWDGIGDYNSFKQIYDVNQDGEMNVLLNGNEPATDTLSGIRVARIFKVNDTTNLPTDILFDYKQWYQMIDPKWGEYDKREGSDLFYCGGGDGLIVAAAKYDKNINNAIRVFFFPIPDDIFYLAGLSNWDIDEDGYADLVTGGLYGDIVIFEYDSNIENYRDVWYGDAGTFNVYIHFNTNDIDGNGKKEIWVGGDAIYGNVTKTRLTCLEAIGDNQYEAKHVIDIVGRMSFDAYNGFAVDIDKDGTDEIGLCLDQTFMILKFNGTKNQWAFNLFYLKLNGASSSNGIYNGATMYDVNNDGYEELLIIKYENIYNYKAYTSIYKPTDLVEVREGNNVSLYKLYQNYPNPFNPSTTISYQLPKESFVNLTVYNSLGQEVAVLVNETQTKGKYSVKFNATSAGGELSSGLYFYRLQCGEFNSVRKMILTK